MAMEVQGTRRPQDAGVKVKFIETQFISSDAASFKAVVQRLTGKSPTTAASSSSQTAQAPALPQRPRPCRPAFAGAGQRQQQAAAAGWTTTDQQQAAGGYLAMMMPAPKQEPPRLLEHMDELCDFADLFYTTAAASARCDGGGGAFPY